MKVKEEPVDNVQEKPSSTTDEVKVKTEPKEVDTTVSDIKIEVLIEVKGIEIILEEKKFK